MKETIPQHYLVQLRELFSRVGFRSPSMADIAAHLSISTKTLYRYVSNKEELLILVLQYSFSTIQIEVKNRLETQNSLRKKFEQIVMLIGSFYHEYNEKSSQDLEKYYPMAHNVFTRFQEKTIKKSITKLLKQAKKEFPQQFQWNSQLITSFLVANVQQLESNQRLEPGSLSIQKKYEQLIQFYTSTFFTSHPKKQKR